MSEVATAVQRHRHEYVARVNRVLDHVETNLDGDLSLPTLARVACFSPFHFHRVFAALMGETVGRFIARVRAEKAATLLLAHPRRPVTEIALDCGYSGSAAFARAFKEVFGLSATAWRARAEAGAFERRAPKQREPHILSFDLDRTTATPTWTVAVRGMEPVTVVVRDLPERHVIYVRHVGPYQGMAEVFATMFETLARWASARGLTGPDTLALATYHDNPDITDDDKLRVSACFTVPPGTVGSGEVGAMVLPGGPCAVGHFELDATQYGAAWEAMVCRWLPGSGYEPDDRLCYELYPSPGCDGKGAEPVQIHFPVRPLS